MDNQSLVPQEHNDFSPASRVADEVARRNRLGNYQRGLSAQTLRRHRADMKLFSAYLDAGHIAHGNLLEDIQAWAGMSFGIVEGFREWMLQGGYALGTIAARVITVKKYCQIARECEVISSENNEMIQKVKSSFAGRVAINVNEKREKTRRGYKKAEATNISLSHVQALKTLLERDTSYVGRRDYLLFCLLVHQGFRCGEIAALKVSDVNLAGGKVLAYRSKVDLTQTHKMHESTLRAMQQYLKIVKPTKYLFEGVDRKEWTDKNGVYHKEHKREQGLATRSINERVRDLGKLVGIDTLSPHDLRHYWTTDLFENGTPLDKVMEAGGWKSYEMPLNHYRRNNTVANEGVKQSQ